MITAAEDLVHRLYSHTNDDEWAYVEALLRRIGYYWRCERCENGLNILQGEPCTTCKRTNPKETP